MKPIVTIVDDDMRHCFAFTVILEDAGFECQSFGDGTAFLAGYTKRSGCILLDLIMPGIDGLEVLREMRRRGWRTPVITLTHSEFDLAGKKSLEAGALARVIRPVCCDKLVDVVKNALVIDAWQRREESWRRVCR
jgi:two-component system response regulator FixJ